MDLQIKDVADLLNVSEKTINRWLAEGKIPSYCIQNTHQFDLTLIEDWVMNQKGLVQDKTPPLSPSEKNPLKGGVKQFSLYRALHKGLVLKDVPGSTKEEVIRNTMEQLSEFLEADIETIVHMLLNREKLQATALGHGVGIPHTRDSFLMSNCDVVVTVYPKQLLEYGALDGEPVHTLFFLFACDDKRHLQLLAKIAHLVSDVDSLEFLKTKPDKESLLSYVKNFEANLRTR